MNGFLFFNLSCFLTLITVCKSSIKWDIKGEYLIYGRDATLTCNGKSCPSKAIKKWIGGPYYNLLCFDDYSTDISKYEMMSNETRQDFDLMIKGFNFSDANCEYTCSCGFLQYTNTLILGDSNFIYLPVVDEDYSKQNADTFEIDLIMKVFPLPTCELSYEDNAISVSVSVKKGTTEYGLSLYTGRIHCTLDLKSYKCKGNVSLTCQVRSLKHRLLYQNIDFCGGKDENHEHSAEYVSKIIISVFGFMIFSGTIAFFVYQYGKKQCNPTGRESVQMVISSNETNVTPISNLPSNEAEASPISNLPVNEAVANSISSLPSNEADATPISNLPSNEKDATPIANTPSNKTETTPTYLLLTETRKIPILKKNSNEAKVTPMFNLPSCETDATLMLNVLSNDTAATSISNLLSNETKLSQMLNLSSYKKELTPMLNAHTENDGVKYKYFPIATDGHTKEYEYG